MEKTAQGSHYAPVAGIGVGLPVCEGAVEQGERTSAPAADGGVTEEMTE